ncbi:MAG: MBL fold metallo-hydrolase [Lentisphaeria bacterium]|nr:MBL fold metallo-hydrolase [Lentisphaeria bacterium]
MSVSITSLVDTRTTESCRSEFGLAIYMNVYGRRLLLDTGAGDALTPNAAALGVNLDSLDGIILSHGHYDHTGGLARLSPLCPIYAGAMVTAQCFSRHDDGFVHAISMPSDSQEVLSAAEMHEIDAFTEILPGVFLTGPIPRTSGEGCGGNFFSDAACTIPNTVPEEQAVLLKDGVLVTGCCHAGLINTLEACAKARPNIPIRTIVGGLHLLHADEARLDKTAKYLASLDIEQIILMHCTGDAAADFLKGHLRCKVSWAMAGETIEF